MTATRGPVFLLDRECALTDSVSRTSSQEVKPVKRRDRLVRVADPPADSHEWRYLRHLKIAWTLDLRITRPPCGGASGHDCPR
jgi:hypothetical protein